MPKKTKDPLFQLIHSLSPAEKRFFKIDALRLASNENAHFIRLFDLLSNQKIYNEQKILSEGFVTKSQLSNLKNHLYKKLLTSLRNIPSLQTASVSLRDDLNNATILYHKGLYQQSLGILSKAKQIALKYDEHGLNFEINKLEKIIESQYITRSEKNRADELIHDSNWLLKRTSIENKLTNLTLWLYNYLLKKGYCSSPTETLNIKTKVKDNLSDINITELGFIEKLWFYKVKVWESLITRDSHIQTHALDWVELFYDNKNMLAIHPVWFIRGNHYLLQACFHNHDIKTFNLYFNRFQRVISHTEFPTNPNIKNLIFIYKNTAILNGDLLHNNFTNTEVWYSILEQTQFFHKVIDDHHLNILKFKISALFFVASNFIKSKEAASRIINTHFDSEKDEIYFFAQLLLLMISYESADDSNVEDILKKLKQLIKKKSLYNEHHREIVKMFSALFSASPLDRNKIFKENLENLRILKKDKSFKRSLSYLDLENWFKSKIYNKKLIDLIADKS